jgi:uncharacterized membrane protein YccC
MEVRSATSYALVMGTAVGLAGWAVLTFIPGLVGAWALISIIAVVQFDPGETLGRAGLRALATILGAVIAMLLSVVVRAPSLQVAVGAALLSIGFGLQVVDRSRRWTNILVLTIGVILLNSPGRGVTKVVDLRVAATCGGVLAAIPIGYVVVLLARRMGREAARPAPGAPSMRG